MRVYFLLDVEPSMGEGHSKLQRCYEGWLVVEAKLSSSEGWPVVEARLSSIVPAGLW